jgi:hypothetical protein
MTQVHVGGEVVVVEQDRDTRAPKPGGRRFPAKVEAAEGIYLQVRYADKSVNGGKPDQFYTDSGWRAWDGDLRWRLEPAGNAPVSDAATSREQVEARS